VSIVDREILNNGLARSLERGDFLILIAVDEPHKQLRRTVAYLNSHADFSIYLVEIGYYRTPEGTRQIISPRILDIQRKTSRHASTSSFEEIMGETGRPEIEMWKLLQALADRCELQILEKPTSRELATTDRIHLVSFAPKFGHVYFHLSRMMKAGMTDQAREMREQLAEIAGQPVSQRQPAVKVKALLDHWDRFENEILPRYVEWRKQAHAAT